MMQRVPLIPLLSIAALLVFASACSGSGTARREAARSDLQALQGAGLTREQALENMRFVEQQPLAAEAPERRRLAFEWLVSSDEVTMDIDAEYVEPLDNTTWPFSGEMIMQYHFGVVMWSFTSEGTSGDARQAVEAGLRSMIAAYRNILQLDSKLREPWLDKIDELRSRGRLGEYIDSVGGH